MATAQLLRREFQPSYGLHRSTVSELWHVYDIGTSGDAQWTADNTKATVYAKIPRTLGQPHPDITDAICTNFTLREKVSATDAIVAVFYQTNHVEAFRVRHSSTRGFSRSTNMPMWTNTGGTYVLRYRDIQREHGMRVETRYLRNGSLTDDHVYTMMQLVGSVFVFPDLPPGFQFPQNPDDIPGIPYLLKSPSIVDYAPGQSRLIYTFETACRMNALPVGSISGLDQPLPALNFLNEWYAPESVSDPPLPVTVIPWYKVYRYARHGQLPFLL